MCLPDANGRRAHCPVRAFAQRQRRAVCRLLWQRCCACTFFNKGSTCRSRPCKKRHTTRRRAPLCNSWSSPRPVSASGQNACFGLSQRPPGYVKVKYQGRARNHRPPGDAVRAIQSMGGAKARVDHGADAGKTVDAALSRLSACSSPMRAVNNAWHLVFIQSSGMRRVRFRACFPTARHACLAPLLVCADHR